MGTILRAESRFFARQRERIHTQLYWELYEGVLNKVLVRALERRFELDELGEMAAERLARIRESF